MPARTAAVPAAGTSAIRSLCEGGMPSPRAGGTPAPPFQQAAEAGTLARAVRMARRSPDLIDELRRLYERLDSELAAQGARCLGGGACCPFDLMGHRVYASTGELAILTEDALPSQRRSAALPYPYQIGPRCLAHARRPLECRVFFCRPGPDDHSSQTYERFHRRIRRAHDRFGVPYVYAELTAALEQLVAGPEGSAAPPRRPKMPRNRLPAPCAGIYHAVQEARRPRNGGGAGRRGG